MTEQIGESHLKSVVFLYVKVLLGLLSFLAPSEPTDKVPHQPI